MRRVFIAGFAIIFLGLLGCNAYTNEVDKLIIHTQGPLDGHPFVAYEIEFFPDGMIKRIRQFLLSSDVDLYQWDASTALRTLVSEYVTEREGKRITQYQIISPRETQAVSTYEFGDNGEIGFYQHEQSIRDTIIYGGNLNTVLQDDSGVVLQRITYEDSKIIMLTPRASSQRVYQFNQFELTGLRNDRGNTHWEAEISFDGRNKYTIVVPDLYNEVPFAEKVTILAQQIDSFSKEAVILNRFLTFVTVGLESTYLLPFVSRRLVP